MEYRIHGKNKAKSEMNFGRKKEDICNVCWKKESTRIYRRTSRVNFVQDDGHFNDAFPPEM